MVSKGKAAARKLVRARILLLADQADGGPAKADVEIVDALGCGRNRRTLAPSICRRRSRRDLESQADNADISSTLGRQGGGAFGRHGMRCCPEGRARWTLRLLADRLVALGHVDSVSYETVRQTLKKTN